jgi:hypothetical protein
MSYRDYVDSRMLSDLTTRSGASFASIIMAALRRADSTNYKKLWDAFPEIETELAQRYDAPLGVLPTDPPPTKEF